MYAYGSGLGFGEFFVVCAVLMSLYFLVCEGTWRCEHTLFCVEVLKRHLWIFTYSFISPDSNCLQSCTKGLDGRTCLTTIRMSDLLNQFFFNFYTENFNVDLTSFKLVKSYFISLCTQLHWRISSSMIAGYLHYHKERKHNGIANSNGL